jgi:hypothetical protein
MEGLIQYRSLCKISLQSVCLVRDLDDRRLAVALTCPIEHLRICIIWVKNWQSFFSSWFWFWLWVREVWIFSRFQGFGYSQSMKLGVFDFCCDLGIHGAPNMKQLEESRSSLEGVGSLPGRRSVPGFRIISLTATLRLCSPLQRCPHVGRCLGRIVQRRPCLPHRLSPHHWFGYLL